MKYSSPFGFIFLKRGILMGRLRIVEFDKYCSRCEHRDTLETHEPCNECLSYPVNEDTHKPLNYVESKESKNERDKHTVSYKPYR